MCLIARINTSELGQSLYETIHYLQRTVHDAFKLTYSHRDILQTPIVIFCPLLKLRLTFEPFHQKLILVEILLESAESETTVNFTYNAHWITPKPSFAKIYNKIFGPTFPGKLNAAQKTYILSYPGISFKFNLDSVGEKAWEQLKASQTDLNLLNVDINHNQVLCSSISVYHGAQSWERFAESLQCILKNVVHSASAGSPLATLIRPLNGSSRLQKLYVNLPMGHARFVFQDGHDTTLVLGSTTQQEVLARLGPPEEAFRKAHSSGLLIHQLANGPAPSTPRGEFPLLEAKVFHNYFRYGCDLMYDTSCDASSGGSPVLKKIVLHSGVVDSLDFMRWEKCNWCIWDPKGTLSQYNLPETAFDWVEEGALQYIVNSEMYFAEVAVNGTGAKKPILLDRNETEFIHDLEIIDSSEYLSQGERESVGWEVEDERTKNWGQTMLYGSRRCIWEVLISNDSISSVVVF
ncbi:hypothetical protein BABINDRAFT_163388 [Babjeviella inositovora NRRL Y-12698]|uniref:Uncharacterized protein n=1 Tax=Babjeviella inositovora NRRL Y-12698 TaxID=984486 RepID=A0A1E3QL05_9ASCO|nr:uncharacterized protein BABINDRAFT_163388 [Babjeviella inositovora NRRL Y-12698]ODQ77677.1 hypothetical protein BABINDRAFT_163388 [Babjeviella inositovora NRRL Y-12698]